MSSIKEKRMKMKTSNKRVSVHSKLSYILGLLAMLVQFYLGFTHINDTDYQGQLFGILSIVEGIFAAIGVFGISIIRRSKFDIYPGNNFRKITFTTMIVFILGLTLNMIIQAITQIPLTIRDAEVALAIVFAAPAEELFFRGFLMETLFRISEEVPENKIKKKTKIEFFGTLLSNTSFAIFAVIFTSFMFSLLHVNYYGDIRLMIVVFLGGIVYAVLYWRFKDITGCILAHFVLNIIAVGQIFFLFNL